MKITQRFFHRLLFVTTMTTLAVPPLAAQALTDTLSVEEKIAGLALTWQEANYNFAFFHLKPDLDWDGEFQRTIGRVMETESDYEYLREIQRFVALLGEGHANVGYGRDFIREHGAYPRLELDEIERKAVVMNTSNDLAERVPVGSVIESVDGLPTTEYLERHVFPYQNASTEHGLWRRAIQGSAWQALGLLFGDAGTKVKIGFETPDGDRREIELERISHYEKSEWQKPTRSTVDPVEYRRLDDGVLYFSLNTFNKEEVVSDFEKYLDTLATARAVILDVRNNGGGSSLRGWKIGRFFYDKPLEGSHWRTRTHTAAYKAWGRFSDNPDRKAHYEMNAWYAPEEFSIVDPPERTFVVPVAILMGATTYSAAEDFLAFMRAAPNVVFVGGPSAGSTGQPLSVPMPGGNWVGITSKHDTMADGTEFVGVGVQPDVEVYQTVEAFRAGRDLVLEKALKVLGEELNN